MEVLNGNALIQKLVTLTELPEPLVQQEVGEILQYSGNLSESLTLDQLRAAMVEYLEALHATMTSDAEAESLQASNDAQTIKLSLIDN